MSLTNPNRRTGDLPKWLRHEGRRLRVVSFEAEVDADLDTVWDELAGQYAHVQDVQPAVVSSWAVPDEPETGLGAARHCDLDFKGRDVAIKERIIDWIEDPDHREYTYDVYETVGFPARVFNTWSVRRSAEGRTLLRNVFYFRMKPSIMTRFFTRQLTEATRTGVNGYIRFIESGGREDAPTPLTRVA